MHGIKMVQAKDVCRCCLKTKGIYELTGIYTGISGKWEVFSDMILECFGIQLNLTSANRSRFICRSCLGRLREAYSFRKQVIEAEQQFLNTFIGQPTQATHTSSIVETEIEKERVFQSNISNIAIKCISIKSDDDERNNQRTGDITTQEDSKNALLKKYLTMSMGSLLNSAVTNNYNKIFSNNTTEPESSMSVFSHTSVLPSTQLDQDSKTNVNVQNEQNLNSSAGNSANMTRARSSRNYSELFKERKQFRFNILLMLKYSTIVPFRYVQRTKVPNGIFRHDYTCQFCDDNYHDFNDLKNHYNETHAELTEDEIIDNIKSHQKRNINDGFINADISDITCKLCKKNLKTLDELFIHLREHNVILYNVKMKPAHGIYGYILNSGNPKCRICLREFKRLKHLFDHVLIHEGKYQCNHCGRFYMSKGKLSMHMLKHQTSHECKHCKAIFDTLLKKRNHIRKQHNFKIPCPSCNETFQDYEARRKHIHRNHTKTVHLVCYMCDKVFYNSAALKRHIRLTHLREDYVCDLCGKSLSTRASLITHLKVMHTDERPFACTYCDKQFKTSRILEMHVRGHLNDKRYFCEKCDAAFIQITSLRGHYKTHHPGVPVDLKKSYKPKPPQGKQETT